MLNSTAVHARAGGMLRGTVGTRLMPSFVEYSNGVPHGATSGRAPHNYGVLRSFSGNLRAWLPHAHRPRSAPQIPGVHLCRVYDTRLANADRARAAPKVASLLPERSSTRHETSHPPSTLPRFARARMGVQQAVQQAGITVPQTSSRPGVLGHPRPLALAAV